jgi:hypothetical protein
VRVRETAKAGLAKGVLERVRGGGVGHQVPQQVERRVTEERTT